MKLAFQPSTLFASAPDDQGLLVTSGTCLVALLIRLSMIHEENEGGWFIEWSVREDVASQEVFRTLEEACEHIRCLLNEPA